MEKNEVKKLVNDINTIYNGKFLKNKSTEDRVNLINAWSKELLKYNYQEVKESLKVYAEHDNYNNPPQLYLLIKDLVPDEDKYNETKGTYYCQICNKRFSTYEDVKSHEDRCRSINYVISQMRKWYHKDVTRAELWKLSDDEFNTRYDKLLRYIYEHTTDEREKTRISFIFNPPSDYEARKFLGGDKNAN